MIKTSPSRAPLGQYSAGASAMFKRLGRVVAESPHKLQLLTDGPFLKTAGPTRSNAELLGLLLPALIAGLFVESGGALTLVWSWPLVLLGALAGALIAAPDRRRALTDLDWATAAALAGLMLPALGLYREAIIAGGLWCGLICGLLSVRPKTARLSALPALTPVLALASVFPLLVLTGLYPSLDPPYPPLSWRAVHCNNFPALAAAGLCLASGRTSGLYQVLPWLVSAAALSLFWPPVFVPPEYVGLEHLSSLDPYYYLFLARAGSFVLPIFFIAPQLARSPAELILYEAALIVAAAASPLISSNYDPAVGWPMGAVDPAVFAGTAVLMIYPLIKWLSAKASSGPLPAAVSDSPLKAGLRCGHQGLAPRLGRWQGPPSCGLAADNDGGPLLCPYGCLGLGDCLRACPYGAINLKNKFPRFDPARCRGCGRCLAACPKNLIVLDQRPWRAFIPCATKSGLKKNARYCRQACLGCGRCRKACPAGAISRSAQTGAMVVDQDFCRAYGEVCGRACAKVCPRQLFPKINS